MGNEGILRREKYQESVSKKGHFHVHIARGEYLSKKNCLSPNMGYSETVYPAQLSIDFFKQSQKNIGLTLFRQN